ncbi:MAG: SGNH/GDSL hydrolase family protein [Armatimonadota bacterium]
MTQLRIVCFGDSVTQGAPHVPIEDAFPALLQRRLSHIGQPHAMTASVINSGHGGENSAEGLARFDNEVAAHEPHIVTVEFGLNDIRWEEHKKTTEEQFAENLREIHRRCSDLGAQVIFMTPNPVINRLHRSWETDHYADYGGCNQKVEAYAEVVRQVAAEKSVALCDIHRSFIDLAIGQQFDGACLDYRDLVGLSGYIRREDGVHPTVRGQHVIAVELFRTMMHERMLADFIPSGP